MAGAERAIVLKEEAPAPDRAPREAGLAMTPREDSQAPRYIAGLDGLQESRLVGWAIDRLNPRAAVTLQLEANGEPILTLATHQHRADIGSVIEGNIAGFTIDLNALAATTAEALVDRLKEVAFDAAPPSSVVALRVAADESVIDLGAFGVTAGELLRALGKAPPAILKPNSPPTAKPRDPRGRDARALDWLVAHLDGGAPGGRPARRFADKLSAEIERTTTVSEAVKRHAHEIAPLFDPFFYMDHVASPAEANANPLLHYVLAGWREGALPMPLFSPDYYKRLRGETVGDPLLDFVREGAAAGVDPHPLFDIAFYRANQPRDEANVNPLAHYLETGGKRRSDPSPLFDTRRFLDAFDLGEDVEVPLEAFVLTPDCYDFPLAPAFDAKLYRYQLEVERGERLNEPPYAHYLARGFRDETLLPNLLFDPAYYREHNKLDLAEPALLHYLREGEAAGLSCHPFFSAELYDRERADPAAAGALEHALAHPGEIRSDPRMDAALDKRLFAFVRDLLAENGVEGFHAHIYREANPDVAGLGDKALEAHYRSRGAKEMRIASLTRLMRLARLVIADLPLGFVLEDYTSIYPDMHVFRDRFASALFHWGRHGRHERRLIGRWKFRIFDLALHPPTAGAPLRVHVAPERVEVCILIHAFYPDLLPELVGFARNFGAVSFDIFINVVDEAWSPELHEQLRAICPGAFVMLSNDNGRDIGGLTRLLGHVDLSRYDLIAFLHSKKSPHIDAESGAYWRRALLSAIAGSPDTAIECVRLFRENPRIGMIGSKEWRSRDMGKNVEQYEKLLDLLGVRGKNREIDYLSGFMFLIRAEIVKPLYRALIELEFEYGGDRDLEFHKDGQLAHGVERALPALVRQLGYEIHYR